LFEPCGDKPLAAVFDVDETVLLNVGFDTGTPPAPTAPCRGPTARGRRGSGPASARSPRCPGAVDAIVALRRAGVTVIYNTNRDSETAENTARALEVRRPRRGNPERGPVHRLGRRRQEGRPPRRDRQALLRDRARRRPARRHLRPVQTPAWRCRSAATRWRIPALWGEGWFLLPNPSTAPRPAAPPTRSSPIPTCTGPFPSEPAPEADRGRTP
jgi:hypothetical protein